MANRLEDIKNMVEAMDGAFTAQLFGYEMNEKTLIEDYKWLIEQAEKVRQVEAILACSDLNQEEQFNNINTIFYNE
ncbi:MAG: hypothetical protein ACI35O_04000 [Bacillaceae bacterium]